MNNRLQCWFVCAILCLAVTATAQVSTGTPPMGSFSSGPDIINLGNLNAHFAIPVFSKPGRGTSFDYILSFDSSVWTPLLSGGTKSWQPDGNWGWRAITEAATGYVNFKRNTIQCLIDSGQEYIPPRPPRYINEPQYTNFSFHDAFGVNHTGFTNIVGGCAGDIDPSDSVSTDAAGITLDTSSGILTPKVTTPQGTVVLAPSGAANGSATKTDRNGNQITTTTGSTFTDTLGMTALSVTGGAPSPLVMTYTTTTGTAASVTVNYSTYTVQTAFGCSGVSEYGPTSIPLASSVTLPDGSSYSFQYETTPGVPANVTGRVKSITLRTGGTITYTYTGGNNGIECVDGSTAGLSRTTSDGTTDYSRSGSGTAWTTTILDASSPRNQTVLNFQSAGSPANFYETHRTVNQGTSTTLVQTDTCYNSTVQPNCSSTAITLPPTEIKKYTILPNGQQSLNDTVMSGAVPTEIDEYDFGTSPHGALQRKTLYTYASLGNNIVMPSSITVQDGSGNQKAQQTLRYDETAVTGTTGVPQHAAISGSRGNPTTITQWVSTTASSLVTIFTYDDTGNILTATDPATNQTAFDYTDNFSEGTPTGTLAYVTKVTLPSTGSVSHVMHTQYEANTGLPVSTTDMNGNITSYTYDSLLRPLTVSLPDGGLTTTTYPSATSVVQTQKIIGTQATSVTASLDGYGRPSLQQLTSDPAGTDSVETVYDSNGRIKSVSNPHRSASSPTDGITQFLYDALGRMTTQTQPGGNIVQASYSANCVTMTDETSRQREICSDALGRMVSSFEPDSTNALNWETDSVFDVFNNVVGITQKGGTTVTSQWRTRSFAYDGLSRLTQTSAPESGTTNYFYTTSTGTLCAGSPGSPCRVTDARSITRTFGYDALSRLTTKTYSDTTPSVTYSYDQTSFNGLTITNGNGLRTGMSDGSGATAWSYDKMGRVLNRQQTISTVTKSIGYSYNLDGSVATMTYPSGRVYTYTYNNAEQIASLVDTAHSLSFFSSPQYAPPGLLTSAVYGAVTGWNAITSTNTYNNRLQPTQFLATSPVPSTLLNLSYSYDQGSGKNNGSVVQITNGRDSTRTAAYTYDQVNRLSTAQTPSASTWGDSYVYDPWGNLLQKNIIKGTAESMTLTVNNQNQVTTPAFTYDAAGNVTWDTTNALKYDAEGRMNPLSGTTYTYDGDGRRVQKSDGTLYWVDDAFRPLSVGTTSGTITRDYIFVGGKRIAFVPLSSGNPYYYLSDHLGSDTVVASGDGKTIQWEGEFFPFGAQRTVITNLADNPYQFTGYEYDSGTGYNYAVARFEAGRWGRFLSPDPYLGSIDITNPQSLNRYSYVLNNPLNLTDPMGLDFCKWDDGTVDDSPEDGGDTFEQCEQGGGSWVVDTTVTVTTTPPSPCEEGVPGACGDGTPPQPPVDYVCIELGPCYPNTPSRVPSTKLTPEQENCVQTVMAGNDPAMTSSRPILNFQGLFSAYSYFPGNDNFDKAWASTLEAVAVKGGAVFGARWIGNLLGKPGVVKGASVAGEAVATVATVLTVVATISEAQARQACHVPILPTLQFVP